SPSTSQTLKIPDSTQDSTAPRIAIGKALIAQKEGWSLKKRVGGRLVQSGAGTILQVTVDIPKKLLSVTYGQPG
ncbi:hypothetical protein HK102_003644, partial [Quaeritorhiza haematococci]